MTTAGTSIRIDHALHGYQDGHRELASSSRLQPKARRLVLLMSDLSGPRRVPGFDSYLTAYPLPDEQLFAMARTWYADEMERPGCVWTHTLFLTLEHLRCLSAKSLLRLFRHPRAAQRPAYEDPLVMAPPVDGERLSAELPEHVLESLLFCVYGKQNPVFVVSDHVDQFESAIVAFWEQQWPELRMRFGFCTGAIRSRRAEGEPLDLQVVPEEARRETLREYPNSCIIDTAQIQGEMVGKLYASAARDLIEGGRTHLREFLQQYGPSTPATRRGFQDLITIYLDVTKYHYGQRPLHEIVHRVCRNYPRSEQGRTLKRALLGPPSDRRLAEQLDEATVLEALITCPTTDSLDLTDLALSDRVASLWRYDQESALGLLSLTETRGGDLVKMAGQGLASTLEPSQLSALVSRAPDVAMSVLNLEPKFAIEPSVWKCDDSITGRVLEVLADRVDALSPQDLKRLLVAQLESNCDAALPLLERSLSSEAIVHTLLDWANTHETRSLNRKWNSLLADHVPELKSWVQEHDVLDGTAALIARSIDPVSVGLDKLDENFWLKIMAGDHHRIEQADVAAALLAVAMLSDHQKGQELGARGFPIVYAAAAESRLPERTWNILDRVLPRSSWSYSWDRCKRLREALLSKSTASAWAFETFLRATASPEILTRILEAWGWSKDEKKYLRRLTDATLRAQISAEQWQVELLRNSAWRF